MSMGEMYCMFYPERHTITCGHCGEKHSSTKGILLCRDGIEITSCTHLCKTSEFSEDGERYIFECLADRWYTPRGSNCVNGHEDVDAQVRKREGWDYASDEGEARLLRENGVDAVAMDGSSI